MDLASLNAVFAKAAVQFATWQSLQDGMALLAGNAGNVIQRLPALQSASHYAGLPGPKELQQLVVSQTLTSLDNVIKRLRDKLHEMEEVVRAQEKLCMQAWDALGQPAAPATCAQPQLSSGLTPAQMVEAMEDVWYMSREELCLKAAALGRVHTAMTAAEYAELQSVLESSVHVRKESSGVLLLQNA